MMYGKLSRDYSILYTSFKYLYCLNAFAKHNRIFQITKIAILNCATHEINCQFDFSFFFFYPINPMSGWFPFAPEYKSTTSR